MTRTSSAILALALSVLVAARPAAASDASWLKLTLASYGGIANLDDSYQVGAAIPLGARVGFTVTRYLAAEGSYGKVFGESDRVPGREFPVDQWGVDLVLNLMPNAWMNPYLLGGWAQLNLDEPQGNVLRMPGGEFGGGVKIRLVRDPGARWDLRLEARNLVARNDDPLEGAGDYRSHLFYTAGIMMTLANPERDTDGDGVLDKFDRCPATVSGASVDPMGCPLDYDEDGVPDGLDRCPYSPPGALVDAQGCPSDADGDGVMDGIDLCDDTLPGVIVDAGGCAKDSDGDGVFDGIDQCPRTPSRVLVDASGCPLTPTVSATETELLDTGTLVLDNIYFETGQAVLKSQSFPILDEVGVILSKWSELQIEIGGHTDSQGLPERNLLLSRARAEAVREYILRKNPGQEPRRFQVNGYGETKPIAPNDTSDGRARNRRVEFRVLNPGVLEKLR